LSVLGRRSVTAARMRRARASVLCIYCPRSGGIGIEAGNLLTMLGLVGWIEGSGIRDQGSEVKVPD
jgi:hypothetical protein